MVELTASIRRSRVLIIAAILLVVGVAWGLRHVHSTVVAVNGSGVQYGYIFTAAFIMLVFQMILCFQERVWKVTPRKMRLLNKKYVVCQIPVHNEDIDSLKECIVSILRQTRRVNLIHVVENGVNSVDYTETRQWFKHVCEEYRADGVWRVTSLKGKRQAQGITVAETPLADLYLTVDSDAILAPNAVEELIKPFSDAKVFSAAGIVLAVNNRAKFTSFTKNILCRMTDLWFVTGQLIDRSAQSAMGSVLVNSGVIAMYRAEVLRDNIDGYLNETFFGKPVEFSDDSMLTIYALQRGKAVQQPSAYAFTLMPETLSHHIRQYTRWMRGAFIRTFWRFKYLRVSGYAFWAHVIGWVQMTLSTFIFIQLFIAQPIATRHIYPYLVVIPILVGYLQGLRYLTYVRSDQSTMSQVATWLMCPIASMWAFFVLRVVRWYAIATCLRTGWGTRSKVEIGISQPSTTLTNVGVS